MNKKNKFCRQFAAALMSAALLLSSGLGFAQYDIESGASEAVDEGGAYEESYADEGPIIYVGDGMRVSLDQVDPSGTQASGTVTVGNSPPMKLNLRMQTEQNGQPSVGQVQTPNGPRPFRAWEQNMEVTIAEFEGQRYRLVYQDTYANNGGYQGNPSQGGFGNDNRNNTQTPLPAPRKKTSPSKASPKTVELVMHKLARTHTLLIPKGWKVEGGAWQPPVQAYNWMPSRNITVTGPDGSRVHFRPNLVALDHRPVVGPQPKPGSINAQRGFVQFPMPGNEQQWAQWVEREAIRDPHPKATDIRVTNVRVVPELTQQLRRLHAPMTQFLASQSTPDASMRSDQLALAVESEYSVGGKRWQQLDAFNNLAASAQIASAFGGAEYMNFWELRDNVSVRAPESSLDALMPVLLAVVNSLQRTPEYTRQLVDLKVKISKINHQTAMQTIETYRKISQATYRAGQEVNQSIMAGYNAQNAAGEKNQHDFINYIRDMQDYAAPGSKEKVTLPSSYDNVYTDGSGQFVLSNDTQFKPAAGWSKLERAPR